MSWSQTIRCDGDGCTNTISGDLQQEMVRELRRRYQWLVVGPHHFCSPACQAKGATASPTRGVLDRLPAETETVRGLRYLADESFGEFTVGELESARRWMVAAEHSMGEGVQKLGRVLASRGVRPC